MRGLSIIGRERELTSLTGMLDDVGERGAALVLTGMAGIGKSTLLEQMRWAATGRNMRVLGTSGIASDVSLPFAGLRRVIHPLLSGLKDLPAPQREAIEAAFGSSDSPPPQPFMVALGTLGLLSTAAVGTPMLVTVEDAHWLDRPTADALAFVGRRLDADPIVLVTALREGYESPLQSGLPGLSLKPLSERAAEELIERTRPGLSSALRRRILAEAEGNPLALCELTATLNSAYSPQLAVPGRIEQAFATRVAELPRSTRSAVLVAATAEDASLATILRAAAVIDDVPGTVDDLVPAVRARLITIDGQQVQFRHPLVRSAVYQAATVSERRAVHAVLAEIFLGDPDRRAWHRWAAASGPDPAVADEVEDAGRRAMRRGAVATAAVAFERAALMEISASRRARLLLQAAAVANDLGDGDSVIRLLRDAGANGLSAQDQALVKWLEDSVRPGLVSDPEQVHELLAMALQADDLGDRDLALSLLGAAATRCNWADLRAEGREVVITTDRIAADPGDPRVMYIQAFAATLERGATVLDEIDRSPTPDDPMELYLQGMAVCMAGAFDLAGSLLSAAAAQLRRQGRLRLLAQVLAMQTWAAALTGDFTVAVPAAEEARRLAIETEKPFWRINALVARSFIAAIRGDERTVEALIGETDRIAAPAGAACLLALALYTRGTLDLGHARYAEAYVHLRRIREPGDPAHHQLSAHNTSGEFVEAAVGSGHRAEALAYLRRCEPLATVARSPFFNIQLLLARAHLAEDESVFDDALSRDLSSWPLFRARIELAYGDWLRARRRLIESRVPLRTARDTFDAIGAAPWAERARQALRAAGDVSQERARDSLDELTPQQFQIVQMVVQGLTNGEIAERLYLSRRTVESHLYRVFPKLGVSSRDQLAKALEARFSLR